MIQTFGELRHLHLEISSRCNARCPRCPRNFYGVSYPGDFEETNLGLDRLKELLPLETLSKIDEVLINGNYGDFVMNPEALEIVAWLRMNQPQGGMVKISTNGSARDRKFWAGLAGISNVEVWFCIDGLGDTHHLYRQDTDFQQILSNAGEFIRNGGRAVWHYTIFPHNEHQIDRARTMAQDRGFAGFETRVNNRFDGPVYDRNGHKIFFIGTGNPNSLPDSVDIDYIMGSKAEWSLQGQMKITCEAAQQRSAYIGASGTITPCCYLDLSRASTRYGHVPVRDTYQDRLLPNVAALNSDQTWFPEVVDSWAAQDPHAVCQFFCGTKS